MPNGMDIYQYYILIRNIQVYLRIFTPGKSYYPVDNFYKYNRNEKWNIGIESTKNILDRINFKMYTSLDKNLF